MVTDSSYFTVVALTVSDLVFGY